MDDFFVEDILEQFEDYTPDPRPMNQEPRIPFSDGLSVDPERDSFKKISNVLGAYRRYRRGEKNPALNFNQFFELYSTENFAEGGQAGQLVQPSIDGSRPGYSGETLSEIMAKDKSLVAELKGFYEDGLGSGTIIKNKNPTNPENKKYFTKDRLDRFFKYAKKNLDFSQRKSGKLNSKTYLDKIQKIADKPEYKLFNKKDLWTKNGPDGKPPLKKKEAEKVNAQRDYKFNNQEENIIKRNNKRKKITEENSSNYLEGKAKGNKKLNLSHSSFFDKTSLNNLIYADASANRKMYGKFEEPLQKKMKEFMDIYNSDASPEIKNKAKIDLQKFDTELRSRFPEYAKLKSYFNFKDTAFEPGFMYNEKLIDPSMAISEEVGTEFKGTEPKSLKSNVIIEKARSNFDKVSKIQLKGISKKLNDAGFKCSLANGVDCDDPRSYAKSIKENMEKASQGDKSAVSNIKKMGKLMNGFKGAAKWTGWGLLGEIGFAAPLAGLDYAKGANTDEIISNATYGLLGKSEDEQLREKYSDYGQAQDLLDTYNKSISQGEDLQDQTGYGPIVNQQDLENTENKLEKQSKEFAEVLPPSRGFKGDFDLNNFFRREEIDNQRIMKQAQEKKQRELDRGILTESTGLEAIEFAEGGLANLMKKYYD